MLWLNPGLLQRLHFVISVSNHLDYWSQGFDPDPDLYSIGPLDPDPDPSSESGSGSRRAKMTHQSRKNSCFEVLDGLFCELQASSVTWTYFMEA
jgi:hypothetical protein